MSAVVFIASFREIWHSRIKLAILALFFALPLLVDSFAPKVVVGARYALFFSLALGGGMLGRDLSSGVLNLLFTRPVRRSAYVLSRWAAAAGTAAALVALQLLVDFGLAIAKGQVTALGSVALNGAEAFLTIAGVTAVLAFFSSLVGGYGDLGLFLAGELVIYFVSLAGKATSSEWLQRAGEVGTKLLVPDLDLALTFRASPPAWFDLATYLLTVVVALTLAVFFVNRREITYAN